MFYNVHWWPHESKSLGLLFDSGTFNDHEIYVAYAFVQHGQFVFYSCIFFGVHCFCHAYANFSCHQVEVCLSMFLLIKTNNITRTIQYNIYCHLTQQIRLSSAEHLYIYELYLLNLAACFFLTQLWTSNYWFFCHHSCVYCQLWLLLNDYSLIDWLVTIWAVLEFCKLYFYKVLHIDHSLIRLLES